MEHPPLPADVAHFLARLRNQVNSRRVVFLGDQPRDSTQTLLAVSFTPTNRRALLLALRASDYAPGLPPGPGGPAGWVFRRRVNQVDLGISFHAGRRGMVVVRFFLLAEATAELPPPAPQFIRKSLKSKSLA